MSKNLYDSALLHISLPTLSTITDYHKDLIKASVNRVSSLLTILISCSEINHYANDPLSGWTRVHNLLSALYVFGTKVAYETDKPFLDIDIIFDKWCGYQVEVSNDRHFNVLFGHITENVRLQQFNETRKNSLLSNLPIHIIESKIPPPSFDLIDSNKIPLQPSNPKTFDHVAVGGTFDHLHSGHKVLLTMTAWITGKRLICGVTDDTMLENKKFKDLLESIDTRIAKVKQFLESIRRGLIYEVIPIYDAYGPTTTDAEIKAIVISKETMNGAHSINKEREKKGFQPLHLSIIEVISSSNPSLSEDELKNLKLSSTYLRFMKSN
ncbi:18923_t:CDS:2 [Funneliformis geosporum]|uniref:7614_t:CDS:1 n=1 Tax=Funneliformis geosporum TaxID=1117311 RepID=A0A9W4WYN4_9GLOM|nr:18923_t:CDS:2 [Funneliformis geosporum]CAI2189005.1 7614_t:CDS:2 [Funneliformis geosporum]